MVIAGGALGGLSAFDIGLWDHADKIDKVGVFSGSFLFTGKSLEDPGYTDANDRILLSKIKSSRKKPRLGYWFYGDDAKLKGMRYMDSVTINHTKDLIALLKTKNLPTVGEISYTENEGNSTDYSGWRHQLPAFYYGLLENKNAPYETGHSFILKRKKRYLPFFSMLLAPPLCTSFLTASPL